MGDRGPAAVVGVWPAQEASMIITGVIIGLLPIIVLLVAAFNDPTDED